MNNNPEFFAVDLFCGAGGTSTGLVKAIQGKGLTLKLLAINHWGIAIDTHTRNYPWADHLCEDLDNVNPRKVVPGGKLDLLVASPECTYHSRAKGGRPINDQSRASAFHVLRWAEALYIENILIENVPEFMNWGPLDKDGLPIQKMKGKTFLAFIESLRSLGYDVDYRVINTADYGDPTTRKRLFIMAKRDGMVVWPDPTHAAKDHLDLFGVRKPWVAARNIIDWALKGESVFGRKKPLSDNTMRRIAKGLNKYSGIPFVLEMAHSKAGDGAQVFSVDAPLPTQTSYDTRALVEPFLVQYHGSSHPGGERTSSLNEPMPAVATNNQFALCEPFIVACNHGPDANRSHSIDEPMPAVTTVDAWGLIQPYLIKYNSTGGPMSVDDPLDTVTGKDRFGLVVPMTDGSQVIIDIRFRMLQPHELSAAMSFPNEYKFSGTREERVKQIGNAVPTRTAEALIGSFL